MDKVKSIVFDALHELGVAVADVPVTDADDVWAYTKILGKTKTNNL